jgi:hypothetical protein
MKRAESIYLANKQSFDDVLSKKGYPCTYQGLLLAIRNHGTGFLYEAFHFSTLHWNNAEGEKQNWWSKFKNIFHSAANTASTTSDVISGADLWLNPDKKEEQPQTNPEPKPWNPQLKYWLIGGISLIVLLTILYLLTRKS